MFYVFLLHSIYTTIYNKNQYKFELEADVHKYISKLGKRLFECKFCPFELHHYMKNQILSSIAVNEVMKKMQQLEIVSIEQKEGGTQLKLIITFEVKKK